eukprot:m.62146 g.62146  ORF g.62146 m.62146 type:complete len:54 (+) comp35043_c0_seq3:310-471(+)
MGASPSWLHSAISSEDFLEAVRCDNEDVALRYLKEEPEKWKTILDKVIEKHVQ